MSEPETNNWQKAKNFVPRCSRCDDWRAGGLSDRCPSCEELVLRRFDELRAALSPAPLPEPDITDGLSSEAFVRKMRDEWPT